MLKVRKINQLKELSIIRELNVYIDYDDPILPVPERFNRYDAISQTYMVEIKDRNNMFFDEVIIEYDKWNDVTKESIEQGVQFLFATKMKGKIYVWNISKMNKAQFDYKWEMRDDLPRLTIPADTYETTLVDKKVSKKVGYLPINKCTKVIQTDRYICELCDEDKYYIEKQDGIWVCPECDEKYPLI